MNRRKLLCGALGVVPFIAFIPLNTAKSAESAKEKESDLIKIVWDKNYLGRNDSIISVVGCYLYVQGSPIFVSALGYRTHNLEGREFVIRTLVEDMKQEVFYRLKTHEYDPVIENSTTDLYLE